uniref:Fork-head domain-containing protein n=1 Tax=Pogona vitticeps TaxID=103695 RepID=A0ABM5GDL1_9SAUR
MESLQEQRLPHGQSEPGSPAPLRGAREQPGQEGPHPESGGSAPSTALAPRRKRGGEALQARGAGKKYQRHAKPPYSFLALIALVIQGSPEKRLKLAEIIREIGRLFSFEERYEGWKESIRHNLSSNACFFQELRDPVNPKTKGNFWRVNVDLIPPGALKLQNTPVSRQNGGALVPDLAPFVLEGRPYVPLPSAPGGAERPRSFMIESLLQRSPKAEPQGPPPPNAVETPGQAPPAASFFPHPEGRWLDPLRAEGSHVSLWAPPPPPLPNPLGCCLPPTPPWGPRPPVSFLGNLPSCVLVPPCPFPAHPACLQHFLPCRLPSSCLLCRPGSLPGPPPPPRVPCGPAERLARSPTLGETRLGVPVSFIFIPSGARRAPFVKDCRLGVGHWMHCLCEAGLFGTFNSWSNKNILPPPPTPVSAFL